MNDYPIHTQISGQLILLTHLRQKSTEIESRNQQKLKLERDRQKSTETTEATKSFQRLVEINKDIRAVLLTWKRLLPLSQSHTWNPRRKDITISGLLQKLKLGWQSAYLSRWASACCLLTVQPNYQSGLRDYITMSYKSSSSVRKFVWIWIEARALFEAWPV